MTSVRREVLYEIFTEFGVPIKLIRLIKMRSNEMYGKVHITDVFPIQNGLKQRNALLPSPPHFSVSH
jgi:hypothetical protein